MKRFVKCFVLVGGVASPVLGQTINGDNLALQSSGSAAGTGWTLNSDGYVGTYIDLSQPTAVTFTLDASGTTSNGLSPDMMLSIADSSDSFSVTSSSLTNYTYTTPTLAAGTYFVRTQLDNQTATQSPSLTVGSLAVSGTGVSVLNSNTSTNALNAATTYATNYRAGNATVSLSNLTNGLHLGAGTSVQVKLIDNAFNFAGAVYGNSTSDTSWLNIGANGKNLAPVTTEQINYQKALLGNFNMIVPANAGKWQEDEPTQGAVNMNDVDAMSDFAAQNGLGMRMHNLIWNNQQPTFVNNLFAANGTLTPANKATLNTDITSRINYYVSQNNQALGTARADSYAEMDVLNEPWNGQSAQDNYIGSGALGVSGVANVYSQVAAAVKAAGANTRIDTNEYNVLQFSPASISSTGVESGSDPYANWYLNDVQGLQRAGAPISGIGAEMYENSSPNSPATMQEALQNLSVAKNPNGSPMPISLTEFGVDTGTNVPSASVYDTDLTNALTMMYGTPQATTFGFWGGIGGPHAANSFYSLYDSNYNLTSAGTTWQTWMSQYDTNKTVTTDANGNISFNGTYGMYDVIVDGNTYQLDLTKGTTNYGLLVSLPTATWNGAGSDNNWSTNANWSGTALSANSALVFAGSTSLSPNNNSTSGYQYNGITFNSGAGSFAISGNAIALGGDIVNNSSNVQAVNIALTLQQNTNFNAASGDLAVGGNISGSFALTKLGAHTLTLSGTNSYTGATTISAGTLVVGAAAALPSTTSVSINGSSVMQLAPNIGTATVTSLSIPGSGVLDVTNNILIINYGSGADPISTIAGYITSGYNGGAWNGTGILSSTAAANSEKYGIGYADSADAGNPAGLPVGEIEVRYTLLGDANLDGSVNSIDFAILASNFNQSVNGWDEGDFNYDGAVNSIDFASLAANFNQGVNGAVLGDKDAIEAFAIANGLLSDVPEPAFFGLGLTATGFLCHVRRRRR